MIAVTGATGHLGRWVVASLLRRGHEVACVTRQAGARSLIAEAAWPRPVRVIRWDLADPADLGRAAAELADVRAVAHLAAEIPPDTSLNLGEDALASLRSNAQATARLLSVLSRLDRIEAVVYSSSFEVYGPPRATPLREDHPTCPTSFYGAGKLVGEKYLGLFSADRDVRCASLRLPAVYGPGDLLCRAIGNFVRDAVAGRELTIHGDGLDVRDLVYVGDAAEAIVLALEARAQGVFNIGSGRGFSIGEIAAAVRTASGGTARIVHGPRVKPRHDFILDVDRARAELGWEPATGLEDGIRAQVAWWKQEAHPSP